MQILDTKIKQLRNRKIPMVKVGWQNHSSKEATWETEEYMQKNYPHIFLAPGKAQNFEDKIS